MDTKEKLDELFNETIEAAKKKTIQIDEACHRAFNLGKRMQLLLDQEEITKAFDRGYLEGYNDATKEARQEIKEHYRPNSE